MDIKQIQNSTYRKELRQISESLKALRNNPSNPIDVSFSEYVRRRFSVSMEAFYSDLGINPNTDTIDLITTTSGYSDYAFLIPEIIREALRLGLRRAPIHPNLIVAEQTISQKSVTIPHINMSEATPKNVGEGETIPVGSVSFGEKKFSIGKIGRGIKMTYEVRQYVAINILSIFLQDFGVKLGQGIDTMAIDCLINGEQADGSESAPVVGVNTPNSLVYKDLLKVWLRMVRIGKLPNIILAGEAMALDTLDLTEFKTNSDGSRNPAGVPSSTALDLQTPVPTRSRYFIHGRVPDDQSIIVDSGSSMIKYNAQPLLIEDDKNVSNQTMETYASLTTGFAIVYRDSRIIIDRSLDIDTNTFPAYMDVDAFETVVID